MAPRFSILLPTHYRPDVLGYAIRSVLAQTEPDFELLVVGDGAVPGTAVIVAGFADPRIRWFDLPKGPGFGYANRNIAIAEARGRLVAYMSDDDVMLPDHLELMARLFETPTVQWAYSQALWVSSDGIAAPDLTNLAIEDERDHFLRVENSITGTVFVYRQGAFGTRRPWPEDAPFAADWAMMRKLLRRHGPEAVAWLNVPTLLHFTAKRKGGNRHSKHATLWGWLRMADKAAWWPAQLRAKPAPGQPHQAWYSEQLEQEPDFTAGLRRATAAIVARAAAERIVPRFAARAEAAEVKALRNSLEKLETERHALQAEVEALKQEVALRDLLVPPGKP